jgi:hypothetical protein
MSTTTWNSGSTASSSAFLVLREVRHGNTSSKFTNKKEYVNPKPSIWHLLESDFLNNQK